MKIETYKILLVGDKNVGKTSLLNRYIYGYFPLNTLPTIGIDMGIKQTNFNNIHYKLQLWDLSGNDKYKNIISSYFNKCDIIIFTYDTTNKKTFENLINWIDYIEEYNNEDISNIVKILVGTKSDLENERQISDKEVKNFAENYDMISTIICSSKKNINITDIFDNIIDELIKFNNDNNLEIEDYVDTDDNEIHHQKIKKYNCSCCTIL